MQYSLIKIPIKEIIDNDYEVYMSKKELNQSDYIIEQGSSPLFDQMNRITGTPDNYNMEKIILVVAKKNPSQEEHLKHILENGFNFNGKHFLRFGKSASQGKDGITAFIEESIFDELYQASQLDIEIDKCVISKYEAQRCLIFSSCTLIYDYMPYIVIVDEYEKVLKDQYIKYVVQKEKSFVNDDGQLITYNAREVEEGYKDIKLSPFDGCGCNEKDYMINVSAQLGLEYNAIGTQVRLPFVKGYSVYVPFKEMYREMGIDTITDVYGVKHNVDDIDCIWNTSMFKGHKLFKDKYGNDAWKMYLQTLNKYDYKLGISKYSHHISHLNKYTRMNFQYLQCLDLWNQKYIDNYKNGTYKEYDILDENNHGKIINVAKYTTNLFERIINGDTFYTFKFLGINNTSTHSAESKYVEAATINSDMLKDPSIRAFLYRKLKKSIDEAKVGKIYCSGFYHTGVGDMIGYLQYAAGLDPVGCLNANEIYSGNFNEKYVISFRSPLVDCSEVNKIKNVRNGVIDKWFDYFKDQDVVMFNMYDISAPQQGGAKKKLAAYGVIRSFYLLK